MNTLSGFSVYLSGSITNIILSRKVNIKIKISGRKTWTSGCCIVCEGRKWRNILICKFGSPSLLRFVWTCSWEWMAWLEISILILHTPFWPLSDGAKWMQISLRSHSLTRQKHCITTVINQFDCFISYHLDISDGGIENGWSSDEGGAKGTGGLMKSIIMLIIVWRVFAYCLILPSWFYNKFTILS